MINLIDASDKERLFVVGDIHGDYDLLMEFIKWSKLKDNDLLVSVGDLIDRGEKSVEVLTHFLFADNCEAVMGNHDNFMVEALLENNRQQEATWIFNGGAWVLDQDLSFMAGLARHVARLPVFLDILFGDTRIAVSHAEFPFDCREQLLDAREVSFTANNSLVNAETLQHLTDLAKIKKLAMWGRDQVYGEPDKKIGYDFVIHGHTVTQNIIEDPRPIQKANQHWIDTGSVFNGGRLTFMEIKKDGGFEYHQFWKDTDGELCIV
ncbi:NinI-like serine-threonine phosphatase [Vibrio phage D260]